MGSPHPSIGPQAAAYADRVSRDHGQRVWRPDWPCPVRAILGQQRRGAGDPTMRLAVRGRHWRAARTPAGPVTLSVTDLGGDGTVTAEAWGPGASWALDQLPELLGAADDWSGFEPRHDVLAAARRHHRHLRLGRTGLPFESLAPTIIEQKVTGQEAFAGFRSLVRRHGTPAPGPGAEIGLFLQPSPATIRTIPSWTWLRLHVDPARSRTLVRAASRAEAIERLAHRSVEQFDRGLRSLPGIGTWTIAEVRQRALGDPDAVSFGDYHVAKDIGWALTGRPFDDAALAVYLEPWRPHRGRVQLLVAADGLHRPRRGPRMAPRTHLPGRA